MTKTTAAAPSVSRQQVLAYRLAGHHLDGRLPAGALAEAAGACGIRNAPVGAAPLSFLARVEGFAQEQLQAAVEEKKSLVQVWSLRVSPFFVPRADLPVFTTALLPVDEDAAARRIPKLMPMLERAGVTALEMHARIDEAAHRLLAAGPVGKSDLQDRVEELVGLEIWPYCERCAVNHIADSQLHPIAYSGVAAFGPREGNKPTFVRLDRWLGEDPPRPQPDEARAELTRRYLRCYGPSDAASFSEWAGISLPDAKHCWQLLEDELATVTFEGKKLSVLGADLPRLRSDEAPSGVRLLPPFDPYLLLRDKETIAPDKALRARAWRPAGTPGTVLVDGAAAGTWNQSVKGKRLTLDTQLDAPLSRDRAALLEEEAVRLARFRGCTEHEVRITG